MNRLTAFLRAAVSAQPTQPTTTAEALVADEPSAWTREQLVADIGGIVRLAKASPTRHVPEHFHWLVAGYEEDDPTCEWWTHVLAPTQDAAFFAVGADRYGDIGLGRHVTSAVKANSFMNQVVDA